MFFIEIIVTPEGDSNYAIEVNTNLPEEGLVKKVLEDTLKTWDIRTSEGFDDDTLEGEE